ncbi:hypothetical protein FACS1894181_07860 [Bacteroidia bacterium]|nr:hypothetical protein FACS189438_2220 [Bacteroidia bacterium]GHV49300.1 hypothetical protein FACS1894181_07860 [Bacteroidia bacterium]
MMKKNLFVWLMVLICAEAVFAQEIHIKTAAGLDAIRNNLSGSYVLDNDIDLSGYANWEPIGKEDAPFTGIFDGNGYQIRNLAINRPEQDNVGLFGYAWNAQFSNLGVSGEIVGKNYVGGVCGIASGTDGDITAFTACHNTGNVTGYLYVGGIAGGLLIHRITSCYNTGKITGICAGGISGFSNDDITDCYNTGEIKVINGGVTGPVGGITGSLQSGAVMSRCYNTGRVIGCGNNSAGGLCGWQGNHGGAITNCYNTGHVSSALSGGIVGENQSVEGNIISNCYNAGKVTLDQSCGRTSNGLFTTGGICGYQMFGSYKSCYYDTNVENTYERGIGYGATSSAVIGKTTAQMQRKSTYSGWDFTNVWAIDEGKGYPYLRAYEDLSKKIIFTPSLSNNEDGKRQSTIEIGLDIPTPDRFSLTFTVMSYVLDLNEAETRLADELAKDYTWSVQTKTDDFYYYWTFTIQPKSGNSSATVANARKIIKINSLVKESNLANNPYVGTHFVRIINLEYKGNSTSFSIPKISYYIDIATSTGNEAVAVTPVQAWTSNGRLHLNVPSATALSVYTPVGRLVKQQAVSTGETTVALPTGIYIIKIGNVVKKVAIQ